MSHASGISRAARESHSSNTRESDFVRSARNSDFMYSKRVILGVLHASKICPSLVWPDPLPRRALAITPCAIAHLV